MKKQIQRRHIRWDSMRADVLFSQSIPFDASIWEMAHCTSCVFKCVCVRASISSPIHSPPLSACVCIVYLPLWVRQKQTELSDLCICTYQPPTHPLTHTQYTYSTVIHQHHPRTLSQTCIWHTKNRLTFEHVRINKCTHIKSMPLAHALAFLSASSHECISTCLQKCLQTRRKSSGAHQHACIQDHPYPPFPILSFTSLSQAGCVRLPGRTSTL